jgi:hypothetical protein
MDISVEKIDFEKHNPLVRIIRVPLIRLLVILPYGISRRLFTRWSKDAKQAWRWAKTYKALEVMYTFPERRAKGDVSLGDIFWHGILSGPRAVRNRLKLIEHLLENLILGQPAKNKPVRILSLGSGAGRSIIETIAGLDGQIPVRVVYFDRSRGAVRFSQRLSKEILGQEKSDDFQWVCSDIKNLPDYLTGFSPDIVEMVGFLDYFSDADAIALFRLIYQHISCGGWFIVSNINPNREASFVEKTVEWPLVYRQSNHLEKLLTDSGFSREKVKLFIEPLKVFTVAVCQKA